MSRRESMTWKELTLLLQPEGFELTYEEARSVIRAARTVAQAAVDDCNEPQETPAQRLRKRDQLFLEKMVRGGRLPRIKITGDPRGFIVRLLLPSGRFNTLGGKEAGWGIT